LRAPHFRGLQKLKLSLGDRLTENLAEELAQVFVGTPRLTDLEVRSRRFVDAGTLDDVIWRLPALRRLHVYVVGKMETFPLVDATTLECVYLFSLTATVFAVRSLCLMNPNLHTIQVYIQVSAGYEILYANRDLAKAENDCFAVALGNGAWPALTDLEWSCGLDSSDQVLQALLRSGTKHQLVNLGCSATDSLQIRKLLVSQPLLEKAYFWSCGVAAPTVEDEESKALPTSSALLESQARMAVPNLEDLGTHICDETLLSSLVFPCLTTLTLHKAQLSSLDVVIDACPVLSDLTLDNVTFSKSPTKRAEHLVDCSCSDFASGNQALLQLLQAMPRLRSFTLPSIMSGNRFDRLVQAARTLGLRLAELEYVMFPRQQWAQNCVRNRKMWSKLLVMMPSLKSLRCNTRSVEPVFRSWYDKADDKKKIGVNQLTISDRSKP
jgi:hypothetical protein